MSTSRALVTLRKFIEAKALRHAWAREGIPVQLRTPTHPPMLLTGNTPVIDRLVQNHKAHVPQLQALICSRVLLSCCSHFDRRNREPRRTSAASNPGRPSRVSPNHHSPIKHVVVVMMRTCLRPLVWDLPGANGPPRVHLASYKPTLRCSVSPKLLTDFAPPDLAHTHAASYDVDNGLMDKSRP